MGLISPGGENLLHFLELVQVLSTYDGDLRDPLCWPQKRPVPIRVAWGPLGIPLPSMPGPKTLCGPPLPPPLSPNPAPPHPTQHAHPLFGEKGSVLPCPPACCLAKPRCQSNIPAALASITFLLFIWFNLHCILSTVV